MSFDLNEVAYKAMPVKVKAFDDYELLRIGPIHLAYENYGRVLYAAYRQWWRAREGLKIYQHEDMAENEVWGTAFVDSSRIVGEGTRKILAKKCN